MDGIIALLMAFLGGVLVFIYKDKQLNEEKQSVRMLEVELRREALKRATEKNLVRTETTKVAFNEAKKQFIKKYCKYLPTDGDDTCNGTEEGQ